MGSKRTRYSKNKMEIIEIKRDEIFKIADLWEELNVHHGKRSSYFKSHFASFTFKKRIEQLLKKEHLAIFAAQTNSDLVGYCIASVNSDFGEIDSIFVKKEYRGKNIGYELTQKALSWLNEFECDAINVSVAEGNESALPFYEKFGFRERFRVLQIRKP
jgi:ribosomal protein S18 acetylase RimI-like enzyme